MGTYKEQTLQGKAAKRGLTEQREHPSKSKKFKPIVVEARGLSRGFLRGTDWHKWGSYTNREVAQQMIDKKMRSSFYSKYYEFRIKDVI